MNFQISTLKNCQELIYNCIQWKVLKTVKGYKIDHEKQTWKPVWVNPQFRHRFFWFVFWDWTSLLNNISDSSWRNSSFSPDDLASVINLNQILVDALDNGFHPLPSVYPKLHYLPMCKTPFLVLVVESEGNLTLVGILKVIAKRSGVNEIWSEVDIMSELLKEWYICYNLLRIRIRIFNVWH